MSHSRRSFLRNTALAGMAMSVPFRNELLALAPGKKQFGIQLWTVKEALYRDTASVFKLIADSGFKQIESFEGDKGIFWGMKNTEFKKTMDGYGMPYPSIVFLNSVFFIPQKMPLSPSKLSICLKPLSAINLNTLAVSL